MDNEGKRVNIVFFELVGKLAFGEANDKQTTERSEGRQVLRKQNTSESSKKDTRKK